MRSSYRENNYGSVFKALITAKQPRIVVECGVLDGYSTLNIADALRFNSLERNISSKFIAYDLWDDYTYNHGNIEEVKEMLISEGLSSYVSLEKGNAYHVHGLFNREEIDFLHVDVSNNGSTLITILSLWGDKISENGIIAFEGGSEERDNVEWMKKYGFPSIRHELFNNPLVYRNWNVQILEPFPSLTLLFPKVKTKNVR